MISLATLTRKVLGRYDSILRAHLTGECLFPMFIGADKTLNHRTNPEAIFEQQRDLLLHSKNKTGRGYTLDLKSNSKTGQSEIRKISLETLDDYLTFTGKESEYASFMADIELIRTTSPTLLDLLIKLPQRVIEQTGNWANLLLVTSYFERNPQPNQYVRNLPLRLPTKFIESNRPILRLLLDHLVPAYLNPTEIDFYKRFHLSVEEPLVKIRFLDAALRLHPALSHVSVWLSEFRNLQLPGRQIFIIENLTTFLTFPNLSDSLAIWGGGFAVASLGGTDWLNNRQIYYWGDLDAHGFQILNQCRKHFPQTRSLLMDQSTFDAHRHLVSSGKETDVVSLPHLTDEERDLLLLLKRNNWRVEQERLGTEFVIKEIASRT
jgi:hypothetical protein